MAGGVTPPVLQNPESVLWNDGLHEVMYCHASDTCQKTTHHGIFSNCCSVLWTVLQLFWF